MAFSSHEHTRPAQFNRGDLLRAGGMLGVCLLLMLIFQVPVIADAHAVAWSLACAMLPESQSAPDDDVCVTSITICLHCRRICHRRARETPARSWRWTAWAANRSRGAPHVLQQDRLLTAKSIWIRGCCRVEQCVPQCRMVSAAGHSISEGTLTAAIAQTAVFKRAAGSTATPSQRTSCTACGSWRALWQRSAIKLMHWKVSAACPCSANCTCPAASLCCVWTSRRCAACSLHHDMDPEHEFLSMCKWC